MSFPEKNNCRKCKSNFEKNAFFLPSPALVYRREGDFLCVGLLIDYFLKKVVVV